MQAKSDGMCRERQILTERQREDSVLWARSVWGRAVCGGEQCACEGLEEAEAEILLLHLECLY